MNNTNPGAIKDRKTRIKTVKIGSKTFYLGNHTYIAGILNVSPESFSDGKSFSSADEAFAKAEKLIEDGADIIDLGGMSTHPGYDPISEDEEIRRISGITKRIKQHYPQIPVSVDTYRSQVARAAIDEGADAINDIWGFLHDEKMAQTVGKAGVSCILMHNRKDRNYNNLAENVIEDVKKSVLIAKEAGIEDEKIILDPGIGFAKTYENNLEILQRGNILETLGYPVLLGVSRKSVIGFAAGIETPKDRDAATIATTLKAVADGYDFVRVHDVKANKDAIKMFEILLQRG